MATPPERPIDATPVHTAELPQLPYPEDPPEVERGKVERVISDGVALIAEADGDAVGYALARYGDHGPATVFVTDIWVDRGWRRGS